MELLNITLAGDFVVQDGKLCRVGQENEYIGVFDRLIGSLSQGKIHNGRLHMVIEENVVYEGIGPNRGQEVSVLESWDYVKSHLDDLTEQDRQEMIEFFFSGNWLKKEMAL